MAKKGNDATLAPSAGEGWDAWGAACGFTSWAQAADAIGITVAHLVTVRKNAPRKTIRLAMDAVLAAQAAQGEMDKFVVCQLAFGESDRDPRDGPRVISWNEMPAGTYPLYLAAQPRAVPEEWREFVQMCAETKGKEVCGSDLARKAKRLLAAAPSPGGFLPNGTRVMWQSSNGTEFPATITAYNPATYDAVLDDGCDAKGFSRHRFFKVTAAPSTEVPHG